MTSTVGTITSPGRHGASGVDLTEMYLRMFSGEVLNIFRDKNVMMQRSRVMNVGPGKSFQFPRIGQADTAYHVRGESLLNPAKTYLSDVEHTDTTIAVDKILLSSLFVDNWEELIQHYETRSEYAYQLGAALARKMDKQLFALAANHAADTKGSPFDLALNADKTDSALIEVSGVSDSDSDAGAIALETAMIKAAGNFASKDVAMDDVCFFIRPEAYYNLQRQGRLLNTDNGNAGNGSQAGGTILKGYGFKIDWTNHLPGATGVTPGTGENLEYGISGQVDALAMERGALGTVMRNQVQTESDYQVERQGTLLVSKVVCGHGVLRPECLATIAEPGVFV